MKKIAKVGVLGLAFSVVLFLSASPAFAKKGGGGMPGGFEKGEKKGWEGDKPPGWAHGEKKGWEDAGMPPGLAKKSGESGKEKAKEKKDKKKKKGKKKE